MVNWTDFFKDGYRSKNKLKAGNFWGNKQE